MQLVTAFNPITSTSGSFNALTLQTGSKMVVINKSYVDVLFTFANGDTRLVIANDRRGFTFNDASAVANPIIKWNQVNIDYPQTVIQLENIVYVEIYLPSETIIENYPQSIQREPLPNLIPYNIGHGVVSYNDTSLGTTRNIFSTNYWSLAVAPTSINGLGYDHLYLYQNLSLATMADIPGIFAGTGKVGNTATPNSLAAMSYVPGPFSLSGLTPVDTATQLKSTYWSLASTIPWATSTSGYLIEAWINIPSIPNFNMSIFSDDYVPSNSKGVSIYIDVLGEIQAWSAFVGGNVNCTSSPITLNSWHLISVQYTGNITNKLNLYVDGQLVASSTTSGAPINTTFVPTIGHNAVLADPGFNGSMAYIGILLSGPGTNQGTPSARYEHGFQSLNVDYQKAFVTGLSFDFITGANPTTSPTSLALGNTFNPGGLLYAQTPAAADILHIYNLAPGGGVPSTQRFIYNFGAQAANLVQNRYQNFPQPILTYNTSLHSINGVLGLPAGVQAEYNVYGYNLLGIA